MIPYTYTRSTRRRSVTTAARGDLEFSRTRGGRDLYRCVGEAPCKGYMLHYRRDGKSCGVAAELNYGAIGTWVECARREPGKRE
jgi:hypothetical protein